MGHVIAVDALYEEHRRFLWGLCYRMTGSAADAEDVVQDTFVRAIAHPPRRTDEPLRPWLVKVALNLARDLLRRRQRREYVGPWLPSPIETDPPSHEPATLEGRYDLLETVSFAFLVALEALTPTARAVLLLRDVFDYSIKETAAALDLSEPNVKTNAPSRATGDGRLRRGPTPPVLRGARLGTEGIDAVPARAPAARRRRDRDPARRRGPHDDGRRRTVPIGAADDCGSREGDAFLSRRRCQCGGGGRAPGRAERRAVCSGRHTVAATGDRAEIHTDDRVEPEGKIAHLYVVSATSKLAAIR